jgi:uncharacterized RDD family membrane protein YckC
MEWYYADNGNPVGPIPEEKLLQLMGSAKVGPDTLVWRNGMAEWKPCREAGPQPPQAGSPAAAPEGHQACVQCGNFFPQDEMLRFENAWVCVNCKPVFLQKIKEGVKVTGAMAYGGFWIRFGAKFIDAILLQIVNYVIILPLYSLMGMKNTTAAIIGFIVQYILNMFVAIGYTTFFLGRYGATPGKMACRLKVVNPDGTKITYLKGFARYFGELLSSLTFTIGYLMAAWDDEKRALHDRVCNTRVIREA